MELNSDLITVQGLLRSLEKSTGEFAKIKYKSSSDHKLSLIIKEIKDFLSTKKYLLEDEVNAKYRKQVEDIVLFLILNSEFDNDSIYEMKEYTHVIGICPRLTKCILINIVLELNVAEVYCSMISKLPLVHLDNLISEVVPTMKRLQPMQIIESSFAFLKHFYVIFATHSKADIGSKGVDAVTDVSSELLLISTRINPEHLTNVKKLKIYKYMGVTLFKLLDLLEYCEESNDLLENYLRSIMQATCTIMESVTIDVFCSWTEVSYKDIMLQIIVAEKAFAIFEKYQKVNYAKDLLQMLVTIARKPKTITEQIQEADNIRMIDNIYKADANQKVWFNALLDTQLFNDKKSMNCVEEWSHLSDLNNVMRILDLTTYTKTDKAKKLALQCAENLSTLDLAIACVRFFYKHGLHNSLNKDISSELTTMLNKTNSEGSNSDLFTKNVLLLFLQSPREVVNIFLNESLKSSAYSGILSNAFVVMKELLEIEQLLVLSVKELVHNLKANEENVANYVVLLNILFESECLKWKTFIDSIVVAYVEEHENDFESLLSLLSIINGITSKLYYFDNLEPFFCKLLDILDSARFTFFNYTSLRCALTKELILFLQRNNQTVKKLNLEMYKVENFINNFYLDIYKSDEQILFTEYFFPNLNLLQEADAATQILKILPNCVQEEWIMLFQQIVLCHDKVLVMQLLTNALLLLAQVAQSQKESENVSAAFKHYLMCYSTIVQNVLGLNDEGSQKELCIQVCRIIREIPENIREESALKLVPILPREALGKLGGDKKFLCLLVGIKNENISQLIAKKVIAYRNV